MYAISIQLSSINAEKLSTSLPPRIDFNVNLALPSSEPVRRGNQYIIPFTFTVSSNPPVIQIILKGNALVSSEKREDLDKLEESIKKKQIPSSIIQAVFVNALAETILLSRSLGTPPPLPVPQQFIQMKSFKPGEKKGFGQESVI